jgi:hypothetical protein
MESCNQGLELELSFSKYEEVVKVNPEDSVSFIAHWKRRRLSYGAILYTTLNFKADKASTTIYVRVKNQYCFSITSFQLNIKNCPRQFTILFLPIMTIAMTALQIKDSRCFLKFYNRDIQSMGCINLARRQQHE